MLKLFFFPVKLFLISNTATVTDMMTDHHFHGHINMKTLTDEKISHLALVHSVGQWWALGLEKGFPGIPKSFPEFPGLRCSERFKRRKSNTSHVGRETKRFDSSWVSPKWPSSSVVEVPEPMLPWKIHHVILFAGAVTSRKDRGREGKEREH